MADGYRIRRPGEGYAIEKGGYAPRKVQGGYVPQASAAPIKAPKGGSLAKPPKK